MLIYSVRLSIDWVEVRRVTAGKAYTKTSLVLRSLAPGPGFDADNPNAHADRIFIEHLLVRVAASCQNGLQKSHVDDLVDV